MSHAFRVVQPFRVPRPLPIADVVQCDIRGDAVQPGGKLGADLVLFPCPIDTQEYILRHAQEAELNRALEDFDQQINAMYDRQYDPYVDAN